MFYLSKYEQIALFLLVALLLSGAGVLTYQRGRQAGGARAPEPLFLEAKAAPVPAPVEEGAAGAAVTAAAAPTTPRDVAATTPVSVSPVQSRAASPLPAKPAGPLSLNVANAAELEALPGIGPVLAKRILQYRDQQKRENGRGFTSVDELLNVSGIGPKRLTAVRNLVVP
jgi:DNA uptake protein ComE-like DNA-binding protein